MGGFRENRIGSSFLTIWARQCDLTPLSAPPKIQPLSWSSSHTLGNTESGQLSKARCGGTASQTHLAFGTMLAPDVSLRGLGKGAPSGQSWHHAFVGRESHHITWLLPSCSLLLLGSQGQSVCISILALIPVLLAIRRAWAEPVFLT